MSDEPLDAAGRDLKLEAEQRDADLKAVVDTPAGQRLLARILDNSRFGRASYAGELTHATAFNEGVKRMADLLDAEVRRVSFNAWVRVHLELTALRAPHQNPPQPVDASHQ